MKLRSMMLQEESDMSHQSVSSSLLHTSSSSPTVLVTSTTPHDKENTMSTSGFDVCRNFQRGSCSYGSRCLFKIASKPNVPNNTTRNSGQSVVAKYQSPQPMYSAQPSHMGYVYFNTGRGYYASTSVSNNDSSTSKLEHGYWGVISSSREHSLLHTPHKPLHLHHVLVTPNIIKNLISVRQFTHDNNVSVDFDAYGFSIKDYQTRRLLLRCDSTGDLYPVTQQPSSSTTFALLSLSPTT
ncbi:ribonuclease H-like domain-containing protein [Tanacetum coccineum]